MPNICDLLQQESIKRIFSLDEQGLKTELLQQCSDSYKPYYFGSHEGAINFCLEYQIPEQRLPFLQKALIAALSLRQITSEQISAPALNYILDPAEESLITLQENFPEEYKVVAFDKDFNSALNWSPEYSHHVLLKDKDPQNEIVIDDSKKIVTDQSIKCDDPNAYYFPKGILNCSVILIKSCAFDTISYHMLHLFPNLFDSLGKKTQSIYDYLVRERLFSSKNLNIVVLYGSRSVTIERDKDVNEVRKKRPDAKIRTIRLPTGMNQFDIAFKPDNGKVLIQPFSRTDTNKPNPLRELELTECFNCCELKQICSQAKVNFFQTPKEKESKDKPVVSKAPLIPL